MNARQNYVFLFFSFSFFFSIFKLSDMNNSVFQYILGQNHSSALLMLSFNMNDKSFD